ncbi:MAG: bleomycin resistance protein [Blastocatellia bacterium]|nr:MAG: bleomycin resistance protein [Blastocatellia bacterium]
MKQMISGIHHVSIVVTDLELSRRFYTQVLGLREIPRPATFDFVVVWYDLGSQHIHLVPRAAADAPSPRHFALQVEDAAAAREHFAEFGVPTRETTPIPGCDRFFVHDPDGNLIEIMQWFRPYRPETDGIGSAAAIAAPPRDRFEPALHELADPSTAVGPEE